MTISIRKEIDIDLQNLVLASKARLSKKSFERKEKERTKNYLLQSIYLSIYVQFPYYTSIERTPFCLLNLLQNNLTTKQFKDITRQRMSNVKTRSCITISNKTYHIDQLKMMTRQVKENQDLATIAFYQALGNKIPRNLLSFDLASQADVIHKMMEANLHLFSKKTSINLSSRNLSAFPKELTYCTNIETLNLSENNLDNPNHLNQVLIFFPLKNLKNLNLSNNNIEDCSILLQNFPLHSLDLSKNSSLSMISLSSLFSISSNSNGYSLSPLIESLKKLNLSKNNFTELPVTLNNLSLNTLDLSYNQLIPEKIASIFAPISTPNGLALTPLTKNLKTLNLSHNKLTTLPESLKYLPLEVLDLSHNELTGKELESLFSPLSTPNGLVISPLMLNLKKLYLANNVIEFLPEVLKNLSLNTLVVSKNKLTSEGIAHALTPISTNPLVDSPLSIHLKEFDLSDNQIISVPKILKTFSIRTLNVSANQLTSEGIAPIFTPISTPHGSISSPLMRNLKELYLNYNKEIGSLPLSLRNVELNILDLTGVQLTGKNITSLFTPISTPNGEVFFPLSKHLKELYLAKTHLDFVPTVFQSLSLVNLDLSNNQLTKEKLAPLFTSISTRNTPSYPTLRENLTELDLSNNKLTTLPEALKSFSINILHLSENEFTTKGIAPAFTPIPSSSDPASSPLTQNLIFLNLSNNEISGKFFEIKGLGKLNYLFLAKNKIEEISENTLKFFEELASFSLNENPLKKFPKDLETLKNLKCLDLQKTLIPKSQIPPFAYQIEKFLF